MNTARARGAVKQGLWQGRHLSLPYFSASDFLILGIALGTSGIALGVSLPTVLHPKVLLGVVSPIIWQIGFIGGGTVTLLGFLLRVHRLSWLGAGILSTWFTTFALALMAYRPDAAVFYFALFAPTCAFSWLKWIRLGFSPLPETTGEADSE